jgi:intracellular septation protein A
MQPGPDAPPPEETAALTTSRRPTPAAAFSWVFDSFGPLLIYLVVLRFAGLLAAIVSGIVVGVGLVVRDFLRTRKLSAFTVYSALMVVVFGGLDLRYQTGFFVKLEPVIGNTATALFFLGSVAVGRPILQEMAEKLFGRSLAHRSGYLRAWTLGWGLFFVLRALGYLWMAYHVDLEQALVARAVLGPLSIALMVGAEIVVRRRLFGAASVRPAS